VTNRLARIDVVEDRTSDARCDEGFLRVRRLRLQSVYEDGSASRVYAYDIVSRRDVDAVAVVIHDRDANGRVRVALRRCVRPPVLLRAEKGLPHPGLERRMVTEIVAGVLEKEDATDSGIAQRAATECLEEAGFAVEPEDIRSLGTGCYPSPGVTDEWVELRAVETDLARREEPLGDGSVMEEAGEVLVLDLREAIRQCRSGPIADMKTEIALVRLCDSLGYIPALDCFVDELPEDVRARLDDLPPLI
jgi:ADP-ribose pyrophosphatase